MFLGAFDNSIIGRAKKKNQISVNLVDLRKFGEGSHKIVDDKPYGGGVGMVLRVDILHKAIESVKEKKGSEKVVLMDARGEVYDQRRAEEFSKIDHLIIVCGRYEGFDERIMKYIDYSISIGDFVLTGGEVPAMAIVDSVTRLIPEVLLKKEAISLESFSESERGRILEHPQYTRPEIYEGERVPGILLSGHQAKIDKYRKEKSLEVTKLKRKDLLRPAPKRS